jgi:hypothetical protein
MGDRDPATHLATLRVPDSDAEGFDGRASLVTINHSQSNLSATIRLIAIDNPQHGSC